MMSHILFITLSNIGDAIMTTPVLQRLHQIYPKARIDLVCDRRSSDLFEYCSYRGEIFIKNKKLGFKGVWQLLKTLRKRHYDLIVDVRTDGLSYLLRADRRLNRSHRRPYGPHAVEDLISIIDRINPDRIIPPTTIWYGQRHIDEARQALQSLQGLRHLVIAPGANWPPKIWSASNFYSVANQLKDAFDSVIIMGGNSDAECCTEVENHLTLPVTNLCGKTSLLTAAAIMQQCQFFLGNDSGLGHLASAVGLPTVTVFGPGNPHRYVPWQKTARYEVGDNQQLTSLSIDRVVRAIHELLESSYAAAR